MINFEQFMNLWDDWNGDIRINDFHLHTVIECRIIDLMWEDSQHYSVLKRIRNKEVISFGHYDGKLCVRLLYIDEIDNAPIVYENDFKDEKGVWLR